MDPRHKIIRLAAVGIASALLWWLMPGPMESIALLGAGIGFFPGCGCHCGALDCDHCSATAATHQVDISGFTDGTCTDCTAYNDSFVVVQQSSPFECIHTFVMSAPFCTTFGDQRNIQTQLEDAGAGNTRIRVSVSNDGGTELTAWRVTLGASPFNCAGMSGTSVTRIIGPPLGICVHDSSAAVVTAL
jgi:hypothetical protein